eukprot:TRINITY_DN50624_c0_g1_i1.p1 TRINITY_DN50624_c0_g1~~TRINITY_DN50624_c0_g1_i1.p1  ORF type:complete len:692 (+),score=208.18 TRINITY_DN50624_c0_g1_i1:305-2380(+)
MLEADQVGRSIWANNLEKELRDKASSVEKNLTARVNDFDSEHTVRGDLMQRNLNQLSSRVGVYSDKLNSLHRVLGYLNHTFAKEGGDFSSDLVKLDQAREKMEKFIKDQKHRDYEHELKKVQAGAVAAVQLELSTQNQALKEWVLNKIKEQRGKERTEFGQRLNETKQQMSGKLHRQLEQDRAGFQKEVADGTKALNTQIGEMKEAFDAKEATTQKEMQETVQQEKTTLNKALVKVGGKMSAQVDQAKDRLDHKVQKVKADMDSQQQQNRQRFDSTQQQFKSQQEFMVDHLAGMFALLGCVISVAHVARHLQEFSKPEVQRKILAILWMVPIYAFSAWLCLALKVSGAPPEGLGGGLATGMEVVRDCYEAYVIYMFFAMMVAIVGDGDDQKVIALLSSRSGELRLPFPWCYCATDDTEEFAARVLYRCKLCVMQFVLVKPIAATVCVGLVNKYGADQWYNPHLPLLWVSMVLNCSVCVAFYGLLKFYHTVGPELTWCRPWPKFLCIKGVVFMTYWQSVGLSALGQIGVLPAQYVDAIQSFLICIEMFIAAVFHYFVFPPNEWKGSQYERIPDEAAPADATMGDNLAVQDFVHDLKGLWYTKGEEQAQEEHDAALREELKALQEQGVHGSTAGGYGGVSFTISSSAAPVEAPVGDGVVAQGVPEESQEDDDLSPVHGIVSPGSPQDLDHDTL